MKNLNKFKVITCLIILCFIFISCTQKNHQIEKNFLNQAIQEIKIPDHYKWVVILPGAGCPGCIQEGEYFMKKNINNPNLFFILTKLSSLKILQHKIGYNLHERPNVYIDRDNLFDIPTDNTIYPCVIQINKGQYLQHIFQSPKTAALHFLGQKLQKDENKS